MGAFVLLLLCNDFVIEGGRQQSPEVDVKGKTARFKI